jgi:hypothetical protein
MAALLNVKIWLQAVDLIDSRHGVAWKPELTIMQRFLSRQIVGLAWAIGCLTAWAPAVDAYQVQQVGDISIAFHATPNDQPIANQPSDVWIQIKQGEAVIDRSECQNCRLSLLAPDGQILNQFDGEELQPIATTDYDGAFGATMIFGAPGKFLVQFEGTIDQQPINLSFAIPVQAE